MKSTETGGKKSSKSLTCTSTLSRDILIFQKFCFKNAFGKMLLEENVALIVS